MPLETPAPLHKRKQISKIITDLSHVTQDEYESEPEVSEFDLGTKIGTPKEVMLEELSLLKNRGSKMFKMRKQRVEKFIYENNPDIFSSESMDNLQKFVPSLGGQMGGQMINVGGHFLSKQAGQLNFVGLNLGKGAHFPPPKPGNKGARTKGAGGAGDAGRLGGSDHRKAGKGEGTSTISPLKGCLALSKSENDAEKHPHVKTYVSPWEKAMNGDENLLATLKTSMPGPIKQKDFPKWKMFNSCAVPYGGFEKASQFMKFQLPKIVAPKLEPEPPVVYQHDINCRPSFNRTPIGWMGSSEPSSIHMETDAVPFDGETEEL
uniref:Myozenin 1a n=1 Tax=Mola mola TaxID=94237 RepID=A0A3Q3WC81_MOLML